MQKLQLKVERKQAETHKAVAEKNANDNNVKQRDGMIESLQKQVQTMKEDYRTLEHQHELTLKSRSEMERQHESVMRDLRDRHMQEIDRLERRCKHDELRSQNVIDGLEGRLQQLQNEQINWHADAKTLQAQLANEKLSHQETMHRMATTKYVMPTQ